MSMSKRSSKLAKRITASTRSCFNARVLKRARRHHLSPEKHTGARAPTHPLTLTHTHTHTSARSGGRTCGGARRARDSGRADRCVPRASPRWRRPSSPADSSRGLCLRTRERHAHNRYTRTHTNAKRARAFHSHNCHFCNSMNPAARAADCLLHSRIRQSDRWHAWLMNM